MAHLEGPLRFKDKVAIITGSGQGIGQSIAKALAREGASLLINDIDAEAARKRLRK
jgi:NAD(P)-dependent dehydrogenase (short-subunit alcohol dehydrogenase family)